MRLLKLTETGDLCLTTFHSGEIPPYAILSHTWGPISEEVTFADLGSNREKDRAGYQKLQICGNKALEDGLSYFWVDACCINKTSSTELGEAINSMFRWYQNATRCYVYLSDIVVNEADPSGDHYQPTWHSSFRNSRWFTRGWTLQELLAPTSVHFLSRDGKVLGDKLSLATQIHDITGIPITALRGAPLSTFSVEDRLRWAESRLTTRPEDKAYSLLGLFGVYMPLIYGEGEEHAYRRLEQAIKGTIGHAFFNVPFQRDREFVGREELLERMEQKLDKQGTTIALCGLGGVGKSQLAIEYAYRARNRRPGLSVFWVHASNLARFEQSYRNVADLAKIPGREDSKANIYQLVRDWLQHIIEHPWILVLDDFEKFELQTSHLKSQTSLSIPFNYLPQSEQGKIIITSRNRAAVRTVVEASDVIQIKPMDPMEASALLHSSMTVSIVESNASELVERLEFIPLAIVQAAAFISKRSPRYSIRQYLEDFQGDERKMARLLGSEFGDPRRDSSAINPILTTWHISFMEIRRSRQSAADVLSLMSFFDPEGIPAALIGRYRESSEVVGTDIHGTEDDEAKAKALMLLAGSSSDFEFEEDIRALREYSFVSTKTDEDELTMHRLVQLGLRNWLEIEGQFNRWQEEYIAILAKEFPTGNYENWKRCQQLFPHAKTATLLRPSSESSRRQWATLLYNVAWYAWKRGLFADAEAMSAQSMTEREEILGPVHPETLESMAIQGLVLESLGRWKDAEQLQMKVMETSAKSFGPDHPSTLTAKNNLASTYLDQGRWEEAEKIQVEVMEECSRALGKEHPDTLNSIANLAFTYKMLGRTESALTLYSAYLETTSKTLGPEHPETIASMANLASILADRGQLSEAETMAREAFASREKILGHEHPDTITSLANLASICRNQGRLDEAFAMETRVLEVTSRVSGEKHPDTLTSMSNLAATCFNLGRWGEAEALQARAMETSTKVLGDEHPSTLTSMSNLAATFTNQGRFTEAMGLQTRVLDTYKRILGEEHPDTLASMHNLAFAMHEIGKLEEAEKIYSSVVETRKKTFGEEHPSTLTTMANLAVLYRDEGRWKDAERLLVTVMELRTQVLGEDHPSTLSSTASLASTYREEGRLKEAEELGLRVMEARRKFLGTEHPDTLSSMHNVAWTKKDLGQLATAIKLMEECVGLRVKTLGPTHPTSESSYKLLAQWKQEEAKSGSLLGVLRTRKARGLRLGSQAR